MVKTLVHGGNKEATNLDLFDHSFPRRFGVSNEFIPNAVFDLGLMPMSMVKHFVTTLNPNGPKNDNPERRCQILIF